MNLQFAANRVEFQELALSRLADSRILLNAQRSAGAYYLAGYVVECGLKACICRRTAIARRIRPS